MEHLTSRKNPLILRLRALENDGGARREHGEYVCDGEKLLREALSAGAEVTDVLWRGEAYEVPGLKARQYTAPEDLFEYASPLKSSRGPVFTVRIPEEDPFGRPCGSAIVLENVQDPGNVGTVIRSANAFGIGAVILTGACADLYAPKTVRATMAAVFRQRVYRLEEADLKRFLRENGLPLYGAALHRQSRDIRSTDLSHAAVAVGSEGRGLSEGLLSLCDGTVVIPMSPESESLNAAVAASVAMWEMARGKKAF